MEDTLISQNTMLSSGLSSDETDSSYSSDGEVVTCSHAKLPLLKDMEPAENTFLNFDGEYMNKISWDG